MSQDSSINLDTNFENGAGVLDPNNELNSESSPILISENQLSSQISENQLSPQTAFSPISENQISPQTAFSPISESQISSDLASSQITENQISSDLISSHSENESLSTQILNTQSNLKIIDTNYHVDPIVNLVKEIIFNLILNIPGLRKKLDILLETPNIAIHQISQVFDEIRTKIHPSELQKLTQYITTDKSRNTLSGILHNAFVNIMDDGKIDVNDGVHIITLIHDIITLFNMTSKENLVNISISGDALMFFLYFVIKSVLILTLEGDEEITALALLDGSFKLVSITVMPIIKNKISCNLLNCFKNKKN